MISTRDRKHRTRQRANEVSAKKGHRPRAFNDLRMLKCRYCRETENLSHYRVQVPVNEDATRWAQRPVMHCNRCGYNRVGS